MRDFIAMVKTMYTDVKLRFKVNGITDNETISPSNGLAQGDPISPCLYLLCIQGILSLVARDALKPEGIKGINIPNKNGEAGNDIVTSTTFADDICMLLEGVDQLDRFKTLLSIYEVGSGAKNSWEKTEGIRLNGGGGDLPAGWIEGVNITLDKTVTRYLGIYLGTTEATAKEWHKKTTQRIQDKAKIWRERSMPKTREGRCVALRNSILAQAWYLVENQVPPNLEDMLEAWREEAWDFFSNRESRNTSKEIKRGGRGTSVRQLTLIQDHPEGGIRAPDVELLTKAMQLRKVRRLLEPRPGPHMNMLNYWINKDYGHYRQGKRILVSTCDFRKVGTNDSNMPRMWRYMLKSLGNARGLTTRVEGGKGSPQKLYDRDERTKKARPVGGKERRARVKPIWTIGEVCMEPLINNPNMHGELGARITDTGEWELESRRSYPKCKVIRRSAYADEQSRIATKRNENMARAGLTHMYFLIQGKEPGGELGLTSYRTWARGNPMRSNLSSQEYNAIIDNIPEEWKKVIKETAIRKKDNPLKSLRAQLKQRNGCPTHGYSYEQER